MGGAGAGAVGILFIPMAYGGTALIWLIATVVSWVLVLPKWTFACFLLALFSCFFHAALWYSDPKTTLNYFAMMGIVPLTLGAFLAIPLAVIARFIWPLFSLWRREE